MTTATTTTDLTTRRVPPMGGFNLTVLSIELRRMLTNRRTMIFTLIFPAAMFFAFGTGTGTAERVGAGNVSAYVMVSMALYGSALTAAAAGAMVEVRDSGGDLLGVGYYNPATTIAVRMLWWGEALELPAIIARRLNGAIALRKSFVGADTNAYRLVNGEGDGLSGVVIDRYADQQIGVADASNVALAARYRTNTIVTLDRRPFEVLRPTAGGRFSVVP